MTEHRRRQCETERPAVFARVRVGDATRIPLTPQQL